MSITPRKLLIGLVTTVVLYALLGFLLLPVIAVHVINKQLEQRATVPAHLESIKFNPFTLELTLGNLHIGEPDQAAIAFTRLYANLQIDSLWKRAVHLRDVELEQASTRVHFAEDGTLNLAELLILPATEEQPEKPDNGPFPLRIDRLVLVGNSLQFQDLRPAEPVEFGYDAVDIELTNLSTLPDDSTVMQISASGPYGARIDWQGQLSINPLSSNGTLQIQDAQLKTFWPYVHEQLPLDLNTGVLSLSSSYQLSMVDETELRLSDIRLQLKELNLTNADQPLLSLDNLEISNTSIDLGKREVHLDTIHSQGLQARAARLKNGTTDWQQLLETAPQAEQAKVAEVASEETTVTTDEHSESAPAAWRILVNDVQLDDYHLQLTDHQPAQPVELDIGPLNLRVSAFDSQSESPFNIQLNTTLDQDSTLAVTGEVGINPINANLQVEMQRIDLSLAQAYLEPLVRLELKSGLLNSSLAVRLAQVQPLELAINGQADVQKMHIVDSTAKRDLLKWQSLRLDEVRYQNNSLSINKLNLQQPYVRFIINRDMSTNFSDLLIASSGDAPPKAQSANNAPLGIRIGEIDIKDGSTNFADFSLTPSFATGIEQLNGRIGTLDNQSKKVAAVDLNGKVDRYAPVTITGSLTPFDPLHRLDITTRFRSVELTTLTPYSGKFAGYPIRKGRLNLDLHYQIDQGQLKADNKLLLEDLQLGERVDSPDAVDLPIRLAIALLKDTQGNIDIELPVSGDLNNPEFSVMPIVWQTLRNLVLRATQAPFKFIAGLAGAGDADLSQLGFAAGSIELDAPAQQILSTLSNALGERPQLVLEVEGVSSPFRDGPVLAARRMDQELHQLAAHKMRRPPEDPQSIKLDDKDQAKLINELHDHLELPEPEAWGQLSREERTQAKRQALIDLWSDNPAALRRLAQQRAATIKHWLVDQGGLEPDRIHLLEVSEASNEADETIATRLQLGSQ
ncbi:MAG: DUF748 domain-containing protein [Pseudomonas sp.]